MTHPRQRLIAFLAALALGVTACGKLDPLFIDEGETRLADGEIRMDSDFYVAKPDASKLDRREILCRDGHVTVSLDSPRGRFEGEVTTEEWTKLWGQLDDVAPWHERRLDVKTDNIAGGPYHLVTLRIGNHLHKFSAQNAPDLSIFSTREGVERLKHTNTIVEFVAAHAKTRTRAAAESGPTAPKADRQNPLDKKP